MIAERPESAPYRENQRKEEGGYWGGVPAMPGCASEGATVDECRANVIEAAQGCLEAYLSIA